MMKFLIATVGWASLVIVLDWFTKKIVEWDISLRRKGPFMIIRLPLLYLTYANKWHSPTACNLGEYPIPFFYSLEISLYLSKLYKVR